jgi:hypothetical protein
MGYDLHVTRAEHWSNDDNQISAREWLELVKGDPELIPSPEHGEYFVIWRGTSYYPETWFNWQDGNIYTKNPDKATLWKLYQMAQRLNAQLQGDDGEIWGTPDIEAFVDPEIDVATSQTRKSEIGILARLKRFLNIG